MIHFLNGSIMHDDPRPTVIYITYMMHGHTVLYIIYILNVAVDWGAAVWPPETAVLLHIQNSRNIDNMHDNPLKYIEYK